MTRAPRALAIWMAARPTPPAAPWMSTLSPRFSLASSTRPYQAVRKATGMLAALSAVVPAGSGMNTRRGAVTWLEKALLAKPTTSSPA